MLVDAVPLMPTNILFTVAERVEIGIGLEVEQGQPLVSPLEVKVHLQCHVRIHLNKIVRKLENTK